ncbi:protein adenylyltransferase SelO [Pseudooceanicola aestuarii]|uniref:protein adenylyltransferase SelO n=1 Tax=Pseudooceanicola aestuarii TaxID=2697319 RepID=UPI0013D80FB4|nr:YdiU family protein [Pseudooceanicola aestuarii]
MTLHIPFDNSFARLPEGFAARHAPDPVPAPRLLAVNRPLAADLGITLPDDDDALARVFSGNALPEGAEPLAQVYAGHQFGGFSPQLGDGRALLIGEVAPQNGPRRDIQLKGSGRTPFSRMGDGRAWMGPVLREYLVSEAMQALGIPTTRALAAVATGETVQRETGLPGAVLTRVAASHLRVGHFEYFAARRDTPRLHMLLDYAIARHAPDAATPLDFLQTVIARQADLVAQWMSVGFIHGVMNTDNTSISGETIDYGPCAFLDSYHLERVFSSIDTGGRYGFANQAAILPWNMAQLASALIAAEPQGAAVLEAYTQAVHAMPTAIETAWLHRFGQKIGLARAAQSDRPLIDALLGLMMRDGADFTNTFRALSGADPAAARDQFLDRAAFDDWAGDWQARLRQEDDPAALMARVNPALIPRNHRVEAMIQAAVAGNMAPFQELSDALATPFADPGDAADLTRPPTAEEAVTRTFCGT